MDMYDANQSWQNKLFSHVLFLALSAIVVVWIHDPSSTLALRGPVSCTLANGLRNDALKYLVEGEEARRALARVKKAATIQLRHHQHFLVSRFHPSSAL